MSSQVDQVAAKCQNTKTIMCCLALAKYDKNQNDSVCDLNEPKTRTVNCLDVAESTRLVNSARPPDRPVRLSAVHLTVSLRFGKVWQVIISFHTF